MAIGPVSKVWFVLVPGSDVYDQCVLPNGEPIDVP